MPTVQLKHSFGEPTLMEGVERSWVVRGPAQGVRGPARGVRGPARVVRGPARVVRGPARVVRGPVRVVRGPIDDGLSTHCRTSKHAKNVPGDVNISKFSRGRTPEPPSLNFLPFSVCGSTLVVRGPEWVVRGPARVVRGPARVVRGPTRVVRGPRGLVDNPFHPLLMGPGGAPKMPPGGALKSKFI